MTPACTSAPVSQVWLPASSVPRVADPLLLAKHMDHQHNPYTPRTPSTSFCASKRAVQASVMGADCRQGQAVDAFAQTTCCWSSTWRVRAGVSPPSCRSDRCPSTRQLPCAKFS